MHQYDFKPLGINFDWFDCSVSRIELRALPRNAMKQQSWSERNILMNITSLIFSSYLLRYYVTCMNEYYIKIDLNKRLTVTSLIKSGSCIFKEQFLKLSLDWRTTTPHQSQRIFLPYPPLVYRRSARPWTTTGRLLRPAEAADAERQGTRTTH